MYFEAKASIVVQTTDRPDAATVINDATEYVAAYYPVGVTPGIRSVTVRNSYAALIHLVRRVESDRANMSSQGAELASVNLDVQRNRVLAVFVDTPREVRARIVSAYGGPDAIAGAMTNRGSRRKL